MSFLDQARYQRYAPKSKINHLFITGFGRSGTTFLVSLMRRCGLNTGFPLNQELAVSATKGGGEWHVPQGNRPWPEDNEFKLEMKRLDVEIQKLDVKDRASARAMGVAKGFMPQVVLSSIFVCGFIYVLGVLFQGESVNESMMEPAMYVLGILSAGIIQIMNFWFGSSSGSKDKTKAMTMIAENGAR